MKCRWLENKQIPNVTDKSTLSYLQIKILLPIKGKKVNFHSSVSLLEENVLELTLLSFPIYCRVVLIAEQPWST